MLDPIPSDAFTITPAHHTPELLYETVLFDGAKLGVRVHPDRSICRITYETPPEHDYPDVVEELTLLVADGVPEFSKQSIRGTGGQSIGHEDILYLYAYLPRAIKALDSPDEARLRSALETYIRHSTN